MPASGFGKGFARLCSALRTDLAWVRAKTRYDQRASEWKAGKESPNRLLYGDDIAAAKKWMNERHPDWPRISEEICEFIVASEEEERKRNDKDLRLIQEKEDAQANTARAQKRFQKILVAGLLIVVALAAVTTWNRIEAVRAQRRAQGVLDLVGWLGHRLLGRERTVSPEQKDAMRELCKEAISLTHEIAVNRASRDADAQKKRFDDLYYGRLYAVEIYQRLRSQPIRRIVDELGGESEIETEMITFGGILEGKEKGDITQQACALRNACNKFIATPDPPPSKSVSKSTK